MNCACLMTKAFPKLTIVVSYAINSSRATASSCLLSLTKIIVFFVDFKVNPLLKFGDVIVSKTGCLSVLAQKDLFAQEKALPIDISRLYHTEIILN